MLTKTHYLAYRQCPKQLWLALHQPHLATPPTPLQQHALQIGQDVDQHARAFMPATAEPQFQTTLTADDLLIRTDILLPHPEGGTHLIEVKATSRYKPAEHLPDIAFQLHVARLAGLEVRQVSLMHLNPACRAPDLSNLFVITDLTAEAEQQQAQIALDVAEMRRIAAETTPPDIFIGKQCQKKSDPCAFVPHCWQNPNDITVYDIPHLSKQNEEALRQGQIVQLADIPTQVHLTELQSKFVAFHRQQEVEINRPAIQAELTQLDYPLHFFDFETISLAIPTHAGTTPYQQLPFQYSCHILHADGTLEHRQFLHTTAADPRPTLVAQLVHDIQPEGHIVVYSKQFERERLRELAVAFPEYTAELESIIGRLWDQLVLIRNHYHHPRFNGSNSLKSVLPVLVPHLTYKTLGVQNGGQAQATWAKLIASPDTAERTHLADQLLAYCHLDTLAMVEIHKHLLAMSNEQ
ncbi:MAG: DUF2779 domain-containing protein [Chloroflexi bacterium]|nr:DUF2779 domain-containing protein [Chloroflexota bacterium]